MAQKRAKYALDKVLEVTKNKDEKAKKEFKSFSAGAPSMILQNGFGQTLAFWLAKGTDKNDKHIELFDIVKEWLSYKEGDVNNTFVNPKDRKGLIYELSSMDQQAYLDAQREALALLEWVKRFASADLS
jgi:CRISPR-associated protein Cmr5